MQVKLEKTVSLSAPASTAWNAVQDIKNVAACIPGAEITERVDDTHYKGRLKVKVGPVSAAFKGQLEILSMDADQMAVHVRGKGSEEKGASAASLELNAAIKAVAPERCEISGTSDVTVTGKLATFGARMMTHTADQLMDQFAANLNHYVISTSAGAAGSEALAKVQERPKELNVLAMFFRSLWAFIKSLFRSRSA